MKTIGVSELKAHLSAYLRRVQKGERIMVMDRRTPVAQMIPAPVLPASAREALIRDGRIRPATRRVRDVRIRSLGRAIAVLDLLAEVREDPT